MESDLLLVFAVFAVLGFVAGLTIGYHFGRKDKENSKVKSFEEIKNALK